MSEQQDCPMYCISKTRWDSCPVEEKLQKRIAEMEQIAEVRKSANRLLEQERNALEAERDRLREALEKIVAASMPDNVCCNCKHCEELAGGDYCRLIGKELEDASSQTCEKFEVGNFIMPGTYKIAQDALKGGGK